MTPQELFPELPPGPKHRKSDIVHGGYAARPGTGPVSETCASCLFFRIKAFKWTKTRSFKCAKVPDDGTWKTDITKSARACACWQPLPKPPSGG